LQDPVLEFAGEKRVVMDRDGRLIQLDAIPPQMRVENPAPAGSHDTLRAGPDWSALFAAAGLDMAAWVPTEPQWTPPFFADTHLAWVPRDGSESPRRIEAASDRGRVVHFHVIFPWTRPTRGEALFISPEQQRVGGVAAGLILVGVVIGSGLIARRNIRLGRADVRGAVRLATFVAAVTMVVWLVDEHHVPTLSELRLATMAAGFALLAAALLAIFYLGVEPYVRRTWPTIIVSWSRVLAGSIRDPLVARDVLIGCAAAVIMEGIRTAGNLTTHALTGRLPPVIFSSRPLLGVSYAIAQPPVFLLLGIFVTLLFLFLLIVVKTAVRRENVAILITAMLVGAVFPTIAGQPPIAIPFFVVSNVVGFFLIARVGLVAAIVANVVGVMLLTFPFTLSTSAWYFRTGLIGIAGVAALAIAAFRIATAPYAEARGAASPAPARLG
jgi:serine/threonine-protein kinase